MPRVSVIIPTYNRASYLSRALQSVLAQTLKPFEVIVVDDGSTDNTADVVRSFGPSVRYYQQECNQGVAAARNRGLEVARGDVIAWLDSDDLWEVDFLASIVPLLAEDQELDGVYTGHIYVDSEGNDLPQSDLKVVAPSELFSSLIEANFITTPSIIVRKKCFDQVGNFDLQLRIAEDYDMWLRLARSFNIVGLPTPLVKIRIHDGNTVRDMAAFSRFYLAVIKKHFGLPEDDLSTWPVEKRRAYAYAFQNIGLRYVQDGQLDDGWRFLRKAVRAWPTILTQLDIYYELAFGGHPRGYRDQIPLPEIEANVSKILGWLDDLFQGESELGSLRRAAYGNVYLTLGMLSDQAGHWAAARRYMFQAIKVNPTLLGSYRVFRRLLKLCAGKRLVRVSRSLLKM